MFRNRWKYWLPFSSEQVAVTHQLNSWSWLGRTGIIGGNYKLKSQNWVEKCNMFGNVIILLERTQWCWDLIFNWRLLTDVITNFLVLID